MSNVPTSPFYFVTAINSGNNAMKSEELISEKDYKPWITNKVYSNYVDTCLIANEMNIMPKLDNLMQFDFFLNSVRQKKRPPLWNKSVKANENTKKVAEFYSINITEASKYMNLMTEDQLDSIINLGGKI